MEVKSHKFQKAVINIWCTGLDTIFKFYNNIRHITRILNTILQPPNKIMREIGACQLTSINCLGYENDHIVMTTALYLKISSTD